MTNEAILFEHDDGRYAVGTGSPAFAHDNPAWHRVGPVDVSALTAPVATEQAQAVASLASLPDYHAALYAANELKERGRYTDEEGEPTDAILDFLAVVRRVSLQANGGTK